MRRFGLIGHPIAHSGSPALFAEWCGGRWPYDLIESDDFEASWQRFLDGYDAINITAPFKEAAFRRVMESGMVNEDICDIGAINIAVKTPDGIKGYNSDFLGVRKQLKDNGFGSGSTVLVVGFGGAGKAAVAAARAEGCDVVVCNRSRKDPDIRPLEEIPLLAGVADLIIYTLPFPIPEIAGLSSSGNSSGPVILEANYKDPCLAGSGLPYIPGTAWLRAQAETGFPLMTGSVSK